jgi:outer membrane protein assembly factor BamB
MKKKHILRIIILLALSFVLSACGTRVLPASWPGITVAGDTVYVAYSNFVYALELDDGDEVWRFPKEAEGSQAFFAEPVLTKDGQLLIGAYNSLFYSLDAETGDESRNRGRELAYRRSREPVDRQSIGHRWSHLRPQRRPHPLLPG